MLALLISDCHFSDRPRDEFKWGLFPWLIETINKYHIDYLISLGDHTEAKNRHSADLTNKLVDGFCSVLSETDVKHIYCLRGNHDHETSTAFFTFLGHIPRISFFTKPTWESLNPIHLLFLPNTITPEVDWAGIDMSKYDYIFTHATFDGAISETGTRLSGISQDWFKDTKAKVYAGDIHLPGVLDRVTYVGATFQNRFNDNFKPRMILLDLETGKEENLYFESIRKHTIDIKSIKDLDSIDCKEGDQVKVRIHLDDVTEWIEIKESVKNYCTVNKLDLHQVELVRKDSHLPIKHQKLKVQTSPQELFELFCKQSKVDSALVSYGKNILKQVIT